MSTFYMTYARSRPNELIPWIEENDVPLLTNACYRWSTNTDRFLHMWEYDTEHVVDAGGYNVQADYVDRSGNLTKDVAAVFKTREEAEPFYHFTLEQYHEWLQEHADEFSWATAMDYACEKRFDSLWSVRHRIDATIDNTIRHIDCEPDYNVLPVLQGRSADDYIYCLEQFEDHGVPTAYVGLGTVCRLSSESKIVELERELRERGVLEKIHGFGVKVAAYKMGAQFESADSQAWVYNPSQGKCSIINRTDNGLRMDTVDMSDGAKTRTIHSFKVYYAYVTSLMEGKPAVDVDDILAEQQNIGFTEQN